VRTPSFTLTGEAGATWTCRLTAPDGSTTTTLACTAGALQLDLQGADGTYTLNVTVRDAAGNLSAATTRTYVLDTAPPPAPSVTGPSGPSNNRLPVFELTNGSNTWNCTLTSPDGVTTAMACGAGSQVVNLTGRADGLWTLRVSVSSSAGNTSTATERTYLLDTTPPAAPGVILAPGPSNLRTPTFTLSGEANGGYTCTLTGPGGSTVVPCSAGSQQLNLGGADGTYTLVVTITDTAGNTSATTTRTYLLDTTPPAAPGVVGSGRAVEQPDAGLHPQR
jgi:hypothetical protein